LFLKKDLLYGGRGPSLNRLHLPPNVQVEGVFGGKKRQRRTGKEDTSGIMPPMHRTAVPV